MFNESKRVFGAKNESKKCMCIIYIIHRHTEKYTQAEKSDCSC